MQCALTDLPRWTAHAWRIRRAEEAALDRARAD
jgi:endogenous inhibitor of DNA gyrase (YacG/DUF329 family)